MRKVSDLIFGVLLLAAIPASALFAWAVTPTSAQDLPSPCEYEGVLIEGHKLLVDFVTETMESCNAGLSSGQACQMAQEVSANNSKTTLDAMKAWIFLPLLSENCD